MKKERILKASVTGVFCAIAFILTTVLKFKVSFLSFDLKDAILVVISLMYGPLYGVSAAGIVSVLEFLSISDTGVYGLIMNFVSSATFTLVSGLIYKYKRTFSGAIISVIFSVISVCGVMCLANIIITPYYMGVQSREVVALIPTLLLPFNACKSLVNAAITLIIYKPIRKILKLGKPEINNNSSNNLLKSIIICIIAIVIIVLTVMYLMIKLGGKIDLL